MAYPKKHLTNWFTTSDFRAINLAHVTDVQILKDNAGVITGARIYQDVVEEGQLNIYVTAGDARRIFDLLI